MKEVRKLAMRISGGSLPGREQHFWHFLKTARRRERLEWGEQGVTEEVSKVRELTNVSMPSSCVYLRASLPVHVHWSRLPCALCAPLCNSRCAPFRLGTWTPSRASMYVPEAVTFLCLSASAPQLTHPSKCQMSGLT